MKSAAEEEVKSHTETLQLAVAEMESFRTSSLELRSKGSRSSITQAAKDVHDRANKLLQTYIIPAECRVPSYKFIPEIIQLTDSENFIGHVVISDPGNVYCYHQS